MTLTDLKYIVALARECHFGRAAERCHVSQPTLSVAIKKVEEQLGVMLFERGTSDVKVTQLGLRIVEQAQRVLVEAGQIKEIAQAGKDPLGGPLRVGAIYTIGPYLLPRLIPQVKTLAPRMPLILEENYTTSLAESLKRGDLDVAILALPFEQSGLVVQPIYQEPFRVLMPSNHPWAQQTAIGAHQLAEDQLLLLGAGNCFRDQVLEVCPECSGVGGLQRTLQGSSLETIRLMVASGIGVTVLPATAADDLPERNSLLATRPFEAPEPSRTIALAWRVTYPRSGAIDVIRKAILACALPGVQPLEAACQDVTV
ncbi:MAG TPA: hydrogen peroxide-inducible genes activator [Denitromonas sp.]|uniref:hydrogen peroxide-inducible genes activator n=1 Tax=Denitromonas sp. TaxID=2734609 RepID=UPI001DAAC1C2|nr:hydrogen peroxide-inducible genes activator [Rhodocyclaceae bacterium]MCP5223379.1 hydrogen peroxide-inducible genes activator [Zoogloeaceae bacterium]HPR06316.1 hydrogen peroxide-inducible genes activator [Denitromonas sp.]HQU89759.1 hydrogen peroxide-inducible genes activator [Denitromonas sp.]HQV14729.1 hydrogen peroxide-inducible genes activator [Denitromonas sp.]